MAAGPDFWLSVVENARGRLPLRTVGEALPLAVCHLAGDTQFNDGFVGFAICAFHICLLLIDHAVRGDRKAMSMEGYIRQYMLSL